MGQGLSEVLNKREGKQAFLGDVCTPVYTTGGGVGTNMHGVQTGRWELEELSYCFYVPSELGTEVSS